MAQLEQELRALAGLVEFPPTPDLRSRVRERLEAAPRARRVSRRRALALAVAALAVALAAAMAVPAARTAILELLRLRGATIERVPTLPETGPGANLGLGVRVTLEEARGRADYHVLVPTAEGLGEPDGVYFSPALPGGQVALVYGSGGDVRLLLTQFRAGLEGDFVRKFATTETRIEAVTVAGERGYWLEGEPHAFAFADAETGELRLETLRLAGNTLLWEHGELTLRLEGDLVEAEALAVASGLR